MKNLSIGQKLLALRRTIEARRKLRTSLQETRNVQEAERRIGCAALLLFNAYVHREIWSELLINPKTRREIKEALLESFQYIVFTETVERAVWRRISEFNHLIRKLRLSLR